MLNISRISLLGELYGKGFVICIYRLGLGILAHKWGITTWIHIVPKKS